MIHDAAADFLWGDTSAEEKKLIRKLGEKLDQL